MSAQAKGRGLIYKGDRTTTGGVVTSGVGNVALLGEGVTQTKMIATCPKCDKGYGEIIPLETIAVYVDNVQAALHHDIVGCDCPFGSNTLIASAGAMKFHQSNGQVHGFKPHANPQEMEDADQSIASSIDGHYSNAGSQQTAGQQAYDFAEKQWNNNLKNDLREYLEGRHKQVCILTVEDAARCALNLWHRKNDEGETLGKSVLDTLKEIHSKIDLGIGLIASYKVSKALGGLGVTVKQFVDSKGVERVIISSLWNDSKVYYAVVNGLNIKKNHPYRITNPTIKQLGVLAEDTVNGFKKGAVLSLIISATINTNELVFNDDYHLVDWCGAMGSDLFKAMTSLSVSILAISVAALLGLSVPIVIGFVIYAVIDVGIGFLWGRFEVEDEMISLMKSKLNA
ncbi:PAAR domain-containing protein [Vibrio brasiliensis]|uniref:PAAR domain-containing protein n=1 Tax=Vibrio brasiliensis TaxID=170652 RepID=UPI001EFE3021|nr:PAAR domain-containing protein [Vibrio brasiliensis]MCG9781271.1 PAAR domain-containing protein [Vibrio brasiliensis]